MFSLKLNDGLTLEECIYRIYFQPQAWHLDLRRIGALGNQCTTQTFDVIFKECLNSRIIAFSPKFLFQLNFSLNSLDFINTFLRSGILNILQLKVVKNTKFTISFLLLLYIKNTLPIAEALLENLKISFTLEIMSTQSNLLA